MKEDYFDIGVITGAQGIRGEVRVYPVTDDPNRFEWLDEVTCVSGNNNRTYAIESVRFQKAFVILKLKGVDDRSTAETLAKAVLKIPPEKALPLDEDEYFIRDLLDLEVRADSGERLGILTDVLRTGANDVYVITTPEQTEMLLPAIKQCVLSVSAEEGFMTVRLPEGL